MKKLMVNFKKMFLIVLVAVLCISFIPNIRAYASAGPLPQRAIDGHTYTGKKIDGHDKDKDTVFDVRDNTLESGICVDVDSNFENEDPGDYFITGKHNTGNYDFSDGQTYFIYDISLDVACDNHAYLNPDQWEHQYKLNYHTWTEDSDWNGEDFVARIVYEYYDVNAGEWKAYYNDYSWTDKKDFGGDCDWEYFDMSDNCVRRLTQDTGCGSIPKALKDGKARFYLQKLTCDTN